MRRIATSPITHLFTVLAGWMLARALTTPAMRTSVDVVGYIVFLAVGLAVYAKAVRAEERRHLDTRALDRVAAELDRVTRHQALTPHGRAYHDGVRAAAEIVRRAAGHSPTPRTSGGMPDLRSVPVNRETTSA